MSCLPCRWLIAIAFWLSGGFIKSGLGNRVAYYIVSIFGKTTLGLAYSLVFAEALLAPAIPSVAARAGGIFFPLVKALCLACGSDPVRPQPSLHHAPSRLPGRCCAKGLYKLTTCAALMQTLAILCARYDCGTVTLWAHCSQCCMARAWHAELARSRQANGTEKKLGAYLMKTCFQTSTISSAMFITAMAANPLAVNLASEALGQSISWGTWALAGKADGCQHAWHLVVGEVTVVSENT